ncbi:MAG: hypothetical protein WBB95_21210 [Pseudomonas sp.]|uniref:hypothetical protein n=1 Tax=Pseudomonas sp. TaxID=306 RepID=UPI003C7255F4
MSLSISTPAFVNVDNGRNDHASHTPAPINSPSIAHAPSQDLFSTPKGDITVDSGTLSKLFDMLELVFKALRDMFAGKQAKSAVLLDNANVSIVKPAASELPLAAKTVELLAVKPQPIKQPAVASPAPKPDTALTDVAKADNLPVTTLGELKHTLSPTLPLAPKPEVSVTNDSKANVQVNVNIDHSYCHDTHRPLGRGVMPRVMSNVPVIHTYPTPELTPRVEFEAAPTPAPEAKPHPVPEITPHTEHEGVPTPTLEVMPELTPEVTVPPVIHEAPDNMPHVPEVDITSAGPVTAHFTRREARFNARSNFNA